MDTKGDIQFMLKPDWVSWEDVCECIRAASVVNDKKGFHMVFSKIKPEEIKNDLKNVYCFVAIHNHKVVGTASYKFMNIKKWWAWGKVVYYCHDSIHPDYRGTDVYFGLSDLREKYVQESGVKIRQFHTAEHNKTVIKINKIYGYKLVQFHPTAKGADYYSVAMVRWDDGCPFPEWFLKFMYNLSKIVSKMLWKPGYKSKFWFS